MTTKAKPQPIETCPKCGDPTTAHRPTPGCPYQGWRNYETWAVKLWLDNEEPSYRYWREATVEAWEEAKTGGNRFIDGRRDRARLLLADRLKEEHDSNVDVRLTVNGSRIEASVYHDLLNAALAEVDWREIAGSLLDDCDDAREDG